MLDVDTNCQEGRCLSPTPTGNPFPARLFSLGNGLTLVHQEIPTSPVAVVDIWVRAGAIVEPDAWSGMAHFLEHMIFKGTAKLAPGVFDWTIENQGGVTNAATSHDYAHFYITTAAETLETTLPFLAELLLHAAIPEAEFRREREVVLEEIRRAQDNPDWQGYQALVQSLYQDHPYGRPVLGTPEKLQQRSPEEMRAFHRTHYQPENMTVVVVGGVCQERILDLVSHCFEGFPTPLTRLPNPLPAPLPLGEVRRQALQVPRLEQARLMMAWQGPGTDQLTAAYGLDLISALLAEGRTSRLVRELREEQGLVQSIGSSFSLQREAGLFSLIAWAEPQHLETVEAVIRDRLQTLRTTPPSDLELARCKRLLCNDYAFSTEAPSQLAGLYGYYATIAQAEQATTYPQILLQIRATDLQHLASEYLSPCHYAVTTLT